MKTAPIFLLALGSIALAAQPAREKPSNKPQPVNLAEIQFTSSGGGRGGGGGGGRGAAAAPGAVAPPPPPPTYPRGYSLQVSTDGTKWTPVATGKVRP